MLVCVNFGDEILLRGKNVKLEKYLIFLKSGKNSKKNAEMVQGSLEIFIDLE